MPEQELPFTAREEASFHYLVTSGDPDLYLVRCLFRGEPAAVLATKDGGRIYPLAILVRDEDMADLLIGGKPPTRHQP